MIEVIAAGDDVAARFDDDTDTWMLSDGRQARVVVDQRRLHVANLPAHNGFRGPTLHPDNWDMSFQPSGRRIAVIGPRAAHVMRALTGADVTLFDCPPTWRTPKTNRRWRPARPTTQPRIVTSPVADVISDGIRTADGAEHAVDAIVYATGSSIAPDLRADALVGTDGLTIQNAWRDGAAAYLGMAVHGFPNYLMLNGPDSPITGNHGYVDQCLDLLKRRNSTRFEVRRSAQQQYVQRAHIASLGDAFEIALGQAREVYDGPATLTIGTEELTVRARLTGHLDPIDGKYHWQGTVSGGAAELPNRPVTITTDTLSAQARITEQTPWGSYSITGVGAPPYEFA